VTNHGEVYLHHKMGHRIKVRVTTIPFDADTRYGIEIFQDAGARSMSQMRKELAKQKELQRIDAMTQLLNRRHLEEMIHGDVAIFDDRPSAVLFLDIDNFKYFNDTYGHDLGDQVLTSVSETIRHNIRTTDLAIRYGGEEIVILLQHITKDDSLRLAETLRMLIDASSIRHQGENLHVTVSIGVAFFQEQRHLKQAIEEADQAMLLAKRSGKNMVRVLEQTSD
jgi:diguanylate cyclase (GGDEF)-like protein